MKEMNPLKAQLRCWSPRPPSLALERRLFGAPGVRISLARFLSVLTPTAACLLLTLSMLQQPGTGLLPDPTQSAVVALGMSNQNFAAYLSSSFQPTANRVDTFGWTNGGYSQSSMDSRTSPKAMDLQ
jgi:hypothetical protein